MKAISVNAIKKYEKDGYLKISNLISKKLVDTIKKEYKDYLNKITSLDKKKKEFC